MVDSTGIATRVARETRSLCIRYVIFRVVESPPVSAPGFQGGSERLQEVLGASIGSGRGVSREWSEMRNFPLAPCARAPRTRPGLKRDQNTGPYGSLRVLIIFNLPSHRHCATGQLVFIRPFCYNRYLTRTCNFIISAMTIATPSNLLKKEPQTYLMTSILLASVSAVPHLPQNQTTAQLTSLSSPTATLPTALPASIDSPRSGKCALIWGFIPCLQ